MNDKDSREEAQEADGANGAADAADATYAPNTSADEVGGEGDGVEKAKTDTQSRPLRVYLDNCCFSRPYDPQTSTKVMLETQAKLRLQRLIRDGKVELAASYTSLYECGNDSDAEAARIVTDYINKNTTAFVGDNRADEVEARADAIMATGVKIYDAMHVASAIIADADYFISVDKRLLKYKTDEIKLLNPVDFFIQEEFDESGDADGGSTGSAEKQ